MTEELNSTLVLALPTIPHYTNGLQTVLNLHNTMARALNILGITGYSEGQVINGKASKTEEVIAEANRLKNIEIQFTKIKDKGIQSGEDYLIDANDQVNEEVLNSLKKDLTEQGLELFVIQNGLGDKLFDKDEDDNIHLNATKLAQVHNYLNQLETINEELELFNEDGTINNEHYQKINEALIQTHTLQEELFVEVNQDILNEERTAIDYTKLGQVIEKAQALPLWQQSETDLLGCLQYTATANDNSLVEGKYFSDFTLALPRYEDGSPLSLNSFNHYWSELQKVIRQLGILNEEPTAEGWTVNETKLTLYRSAMELAIKLEQARITTAEGTPLIKADSSLDEAVVDTIKTLLVGNHTQDLTEANTIINDTKTYLNNLPNLTADNLKPYKDAHTNLPILENRIKEALDLDPLLPLPNTWAEYIEYLLHNHNKLKAMLGMVDENGHLNNQALPDDWETQEIKLNHTCSNIVPCPNPIHHLNWETVNGESIEYKRIYAKLNGKVNDAELQQFLTDYDFARTHECITDATLQTKLADKEKEMVTKIITDLSLATTSEQENVLEAVISEIKTKLDKTPPAQAEQKPTTELIEKVKDYISDIKNVENIQDIRTLIATQHQVMKQKVDNEVESKNSLLTTNYWLTGMNVITLIALAFMIWRMVIKDKKENE